VRRFIWPLLAALGMTAGLVVLGPSAPAPAAEGARVLMVDNEPDLTRWHYDPAELTVPAGTTVVWFNKGKEDHTVTADDKSFDSGMKRTGGTFQRAFPKAGRYTYHCAPHPWMKGTVRVVATATAAGTPAGTDRAAASVSTTATSTAPTATSLPSSLSPTTRAAAAVTTATSTPAAAPAPTPVPEETTTTTAPGTTEDASAVSGGNRSGGGLAGTMAIVLLPTLAGLAIGAKLAQSKAHEKTEAA
jgi:plastocyanin